MAHLYKLSKGVLFLHGKEARVSDKLTSLHSSRQIHECFTFAKNVDIYLILNEPLFYFINKLVKVQLAHSRTILSGLV